MGLLSDSQNIKAPEIKTSTGNKKSKNKQLPINNPVRVAGNPKREIEIPLYDILNTFDKMTFTDQKNLITNLIIKLRGGN